MSHWGYIELIVCIFGDFATIAIQRSIHLHIYIILALNVGGSGFLSVHLLARVRRVSPALALPSGLLQSIAMRARLGKQDINLLEGATGGLWAVVPHVSGGEETADQRPDENLGTDGRDTSTTTEDHDPGGEAFACSSKAACDVTVAERSDFGACQEVSTSSLADT